jgi:hypothetical protein
MLFVSYARNREDVLLHRVFGGQNLVAWSFHDEGLSGLRMNRSGYAVQAFK